VKQPSMLAVVLIGVVAESMRALRPRVGGWCWRWLRCCKILRRRDARLVLGSADDEDVGRARAGC